jgi:hypothetical protein
MRMRRAFRLRRAQPVLLLDCRLRRNSFLGTKAATLVRRTPGAGPCSIASPPRKDVRMSSVKKHRKAKIAKHKRKKRRRLNRHKKRKV